jgi:hypothetical protein
MGRKRLDAVNAITDCLRRLSLRPPSQIQFCTIANTPATNAFSRRELQIALFALEYEGVLSVHHDNSFTVLRPSASLQQNLPVSE